MNQKLWSQNTCSWSLKIYLCLVLTPNFWQRGWYLLQDYINKASILAAKHDQNSYLVPQHQPYQDNHHLKSLTFDLLQYLYLIYMSLQHEAFLSVLCPQNVLDRQNYLEGTSSLVILFLFYILQSFYCFEDIQLSAIISTTLLDLVPKLFTFWCDSKVFHKNR